MFETGQRSAISTSELGLYSDRGDRYNRSRYGSVIRKFVIVVMAVVAVILTAIFIYDFTSGASASSKVSQETKHIYILQNALKKSSGLPRKPSTSTMFPTDVELNKTRISRIQDRSDSTNSQELTYVSNVDAPEVINPESRKPKSHPETRSQDANLDNTKVRKRLPPEMDATEAGEAAEGKQLFNNHAVVYRVRQRYTYPDPTEELNEEESRPMPFHFELKTPQPASFNARPKFPQLTQYRYPHTSRNIQDIIKYLTNDPDATKRGIKFTGVYVNPKKYDVYPEVGEMMANSDRHEFQADMINGDEDNDENEEQDFADNPRYAIGNNVDPFYPYKPKHPADVNLLAPSNVRFSPSGTHRYNPYYNSYFQRPSMNYGRPVLQVPIQETSQYTDSTAAYATHGYGKKRKPKPFSVMLDIYPITELDEQPNNKKASRPRQPVSAEDYDSRRPMAYNRGQRYYPTPQAQPIPIVAVPAGQSGLSEEEERQQMIFHLNLYPRKKNKLNRKDIIHRSETMRPEDHQKFMHSVMSPFDAITKQLTDHSAIEESKYEEIDLPETTNLPLTRNEQSSSGIPHDEVQSEGNNRDEDESSKNDSTGYFNNDETSMPENQQGVNEDNTRSTEKNITNDRQACENCLDSKNLKKKISPHDIDTPEGFQAFADGLLATD